jgi:two-component system, chemotaxis family, CheB/CheR fusion protein
LQRRDAGRAAREGSSADPSEKKLIGPGSPNGLFVGIGASAGSLEALERFFATMPAASGLTFIVVQHLERHHPSVLAELLGRHTPMPVQQAIDGMRPAPNHVYIIAPNTVLTLE